MRTPEQVVLEGHGVRLEPLSEAHVPDLLRAADDEVFRHHRLRPDGSVRDTAYFSILAAEWPDVRARLQARLG